MSKLKVHRSDLGFESYLTIDGEKVEGINSVYVTEMDDGEVHLSLLCEGNGVEVVEVERDLKRENDLMKREIEKLKAERTSKK